MLMANTAIGWVQYGLSLLLVFEIDHVLKSTKFIRLISLMWAALFNLLYTLAGVKFFQEVNNYVNTPYGEADWLDVFLCMTILYNLILHVGQYAINWIIIVKEFSLEYFQFLGVAGGPEDDISLGMHEFVELWIAIFELFNPWWWFSDDDWIYY